MIKIARNQNKKIKEQVLEQLNFENNGNFFWYLVIGIK